MAVGDLCELEDVQAWLGQGAPGPGDAKISRLITAASQFVCNQCGRGANGFLAQGYVDLIDGSGGQFLLLRQWPVISVESIAFTEGGASSVVTDQAQFTLEQAVPSGSNQRLTLLGLSRFPRGRSNVSVAYTAGYPSVPYDIAQATIELVGEAYKRPGRIGQNSVTMKDQSTVGFSTRDMNATIASTLAPYRRLVPC